MDDYDDVKQALLESKQRSQEQIDRIYELDPITFQDLNDCLTAYIQAKFMLDPEDCAGVDFQKLSELSLSRSMKLSQELVREFDTAKSCAGATSAIVKKTLLYLSIQKALKIELSAEKTPKAHTFEEFSAIIWDDMKHCEFWETRMQV